MRMKASLEVEQLYKQLASVFGVSAGEFIVFCSCLNHQHEKHTEQQSAFTFKDIALRLNISREAAKRAMISLAIKKLIIRTSGGYTVDVDALKAVDL